MTRKIQRVVKQGLQKPRVINKSIMQGVGGKPGAGMQDCDGYVDNPDHELCYPESYVDLEKGLNRSAKINNPLTGLKQFKRKTFIR